MPTRKTTSQAKNTKKATKKATPKRASSGSASKATKKRAPKKKAASNQATTKKTPAKKAGDEEVTIDRRRKNRREEESAAAEPKLERRKKVNRRRQIDPTTCERDYSDQEVEFMNALDEYKRTSGRMFPTCSEVLEVIRGLGYVQLSPTELAARTPDADNSFDEPASEESLDEAELEAELV